MYIAPFTMCTIHLEELSRKIRFELVFKPVHVIVSLSPAIASMFVSLCKMLNLNLLH